MDSATRRQMSRSDVPRLRRAIYQLERERAKRSWELHQLMWKNMRQAAELATGLRRRK